MPRGRVYQGVRYTERGMVSRGYLEGRVYSGGRIYPTGRVYPERVKFPEWYLGQGIARGQDIFTLPPTSDTLPRGEWRQLRRSIRILLECCLVSNELINYNVLLSQSHVFLLHILHFDTFILQVYDAKTGKRIGRIKKRWTEGFKDTQMFSRRDNFSVKCKTSISSPQQHYVYFSDKYVSNLTCIEIYDKLLKTAE